MHRLRSTVIRWLNLFRRNRLEADLREQMEAHAAMLEDEFVRRGMSAAEARTAARLELGNGVRVREQTRDQLFLQSLETLAGDGRLAVRRLLQRPGLTVLSLAALACGIGAAAATWSLLSAVVLQPVTGVTDPDRLVVVGARYPQGDFLPQLGLWVGHNYLEYTRVHDTGMFEALAAGGDLGGLTTPVEIDGERGVSSAYFASHDFFETLGVRLALGRSFTSAEDQWEAPLTVVLSDAFWRRSFAADPGVLGTQIWVGGQPAAIVGVAPRSFRGISVGGPPDLYLPLHSIAAVLSEPMMNFFAESGHVSSPQAWLGLIGRLRPGVDAREVAAWLDGLSPERVADGWVYELVDLQTAAIPEAIRPGILQFSRLLAAAVGLLLLIACLAVGMLLLVRAEARREEFAMCLALGAPRSRLVRSVVLEGALLATGGGLLALPVARGLSAAVRGFELPGQLSLTVLDLSLDASVLAGAMGAAFVAIAFISAVAVSFSFTVQVADATRARAGATRRVSRWSLRRALVVAQVAVALLLLVGAGLFTRSVRAALHLNPGYDTSRILTGRVSLGDAGYTPPQTAVFFEEVKQRLSGHPDIEAMGLIMTGGVIGMGTGGQVVVDGEPLRVPAFIAETVIDEGYFRAMGLPILQGRDFSRSDTADAPRVAIVSESFARFLAPDGDILGRTIRANNAPVDQPFQLIEVVGVVPDIVTNVRWLEALVQYMPIAQLGGATSRGLVVRARSSDTAAARAVMGAIHEIDDSVTPQPLRTIDAQLVEQLGPQQFGISLMGGLGAIATLLTIVGIWVLAETMAHARRRELGIRKALGASPRQLGSVILGETVRLVGLGILLGYALAWMGASTIQTLLFEVEPFDAATFAAVSVLLLILALAVSLKPTFSAIRVDAARTLREE